MDNPPYGPDPELRRLAALAALMDNRFRIPGTNIRFGLDAVVGLIPYVGDWIGLLVGGYLMFVVIRRGAGPVLILRMAANYLVDTLVGAIPVAGDLFDVAFKANRRNVELLTNYYDNEKPRPNTFLSVALLLLLAALLTGGLLAGTWYLFWQMSRYVFGF